MSTKKHEKAESPKYKAMERRMKTEGAEYKTKGNKTKRGGKRC
jgi:hypothetical protein